MKKLTCFESPSERIPKGTEEDRRHNTRFLIQLDLGKKTEHIVVPLEKRAETS